MLNQSAGGFTAAAIQTEGQKKSCFAAYFFSFMLAQGKLVYSVKEIFYENIKRLLTEAKKMYIKCYKCL